MAFVNEPEKDRTIDYERGAILRLGGKMFFIGGRMPPYDLFTLRWQDEDITVFAYRQIEIDEQQRTATIIRRIAMCDHYAVKLRPFRAEIRAMLIESLTTFGVHYGIDPQWTVTIDIRIDEDLGGLNPNFNFETQKFENPPVEPKKS